MKQQLHILSKVFLEPDKAVQMILAGKPLFLPLLICSVLQLVFQLIMQPRVQSVLLRQQALSEEQLQALSTSLAQSNIIGYALLLPGLLLKWVVVALLLLALVILLNGLLSFRQILSLVGFGSVLQSLALIQVLAIVELKGSSTLQKLADFQPAIGLSLLFPQASKFLFYVTNSINLFEIWYLVILAAGLRYAFRNTSWLRSAAVALAIWIPATLLQATLFSLGPG